MCPAPRAKYHDLWINWFGDGCRIQFEWAIGPTHGAILDNLLDPVYGPGAEIALCEGQALSDCYRDSEYRVMVQPIGQPDTSIALRRSVWGHEDSYDTSGMVEFRRERTARRTALEQKQGY
jgi:hypothetical protein